jgi:hypothetical protein
MHIPQTVVKHGHPVADYQQVQLGLVLPTVVESLLL